MHNLRSTSGTNIQKILNYFEGFEDYTDNGNFTLHDTPFHIFKDVFKTYKEALDSAESRSYGSDCICIVPYSDKKVTKAFTNALDNYLKKVNDYNTFKRVLNIGYGRKSSKVTCPHCKSMIDLGYGSRYKECPVCHSKEIISDSNWNILKTKKNMVTTAMNNLEKEAIHNGIIFVAGYSWHN